MFFWYQNKYLRHLQAGIALGLAIGLVFFPYYPALATEPEPTPTESPAPTPEASPQEQTNPPTGETQIDNSGTVTNDAASTAESGDNTITTPSPTPTPETTSETTPEGGEIISPLADETTTPEATGSSLTTGDAVSVTVVENQVNTNSINSQVSQETTNVGGETSGNIELGGGGETSSASSAPETTSSEENAGSATVTNEANLTNDITSLANSGHNALESASSAAMITGDAVNVVGVFNQVNTNLIDSILNIFTLNIFGSIEGNILLPEDLASTGGNCCGQNLTINNQAVVENILRSLANTGGNTIVASETATLETGNAQSVINLVNLVNQNFIDSQILYLFINTLGSWNGAFRGWLSLGPEESGNLALQYVSGNPLASDCPSCFSDVKIDNTAQVTNVINSSANTGGNLIQAGSAQMRTGQAYSAINLVNLINTNLLRSTGYFGFINIFGSLNGDIGGASLFVTPTPEPTPEPTAVEESATVSEEAPWVREPGGQLEVTVAHNVGEYVLPGDTVTFFVTIKNPGSGNVYDTNLDIILFKDGVNAGGVTINIGKIKPFGTVRVTTGLVLSPEAAGGLYTARATASGLVGPGDTAISASAETQFSIAGAGGALAQIVPAGTAPPRTEVLGSYTGPTREDREDLMKRLLTSLGMVFLTIQGIRRRRELAIGLYNLRLFL